MKTIHPHLNESPLELLGRCKGHYRCLKDNDKRITPLVGYTAKYDGEHQWVGEEYANFAKAERHGPVMQRVVGSILRIPRFLRTGSAINSSTGFCGAPEGGKALASALANWSGKQYIFPEKKDSELCFDRHEPESGEAWWIVEDVCNNFTTTKKMIDLIENYGASVIGIICFLNRSMEFDSEYLELPVISLVRKPIQEYRQDDPFVKDDIAKGNIVWKPKLEWDRLIQTTTHQ